MIMPPVNGDVGDGGGAGRVGIGEKCFFDLSLCF